MREFRGKKKKPSETTRNPPGFSAFQLKPQHFLLTSLKPREFQGCWFCLHFPSYFPRFSQSAAWPQRAAGAALPAFPQELPRAFLASFRKRHNPSTAALEPLGISWEELEVQGFPKLKTKRTQTGTQPLRWKT